MFKPSIVTDPELLPNPTPGEILVEDFLRQLGLSQSVLARALRVPPCRINEIVLGKRRMPASGGDGAKGFDRPGHSGSLTMEREGSRGCSYPATGKGATVSIRPTRFPKHRKWFSIRLRRAPRRSKS